MGNCYSNWATRLEGLWKQGATDDDDRDNGQLLATAWATRLERLWKEGATVRDNGQLLATGQHDWRDSGNREQQLETMGNC